MGNIQMIGKSNAEAMRGEQPEETMFAPNWALSDVAEHAVDFWLTTEDLPVPENRVTTDKDGRVHLAYTSTNDEEADRLYACRHLGRARPAVPPHRVRHAGLRRERMRAQRPEGPALRGQRRPLPARAASA
jgi:hypothetical protein